jgi:hypothetical protein
MIGVTQLLSNPLTPATGPSYQNPGTAMTGSSTTSNAGTIVLSNNDRTFLANGTGNSGSVAYLDTDILPNTGKYYWESYRDARGGNSYWYAYHDLTAWSSSGTLVTSGYNRVGNRVAYSGVGISGAANGWLTRINSAGATRTNPSNPFVTFTDRFSYRFDSDTGILETFRNGSTFTNSVTTLGSASFYQFSFSSRPGGKSTVFLSPSDWVYDPDTL